MQPTDTALRENVLRVEDLTHAERDQMYSLMVAYYDNLTRSKFEEDLSGKSWVCAVTDSGSGQICGFSTLARFEANVDGERVAALFSGDTIVSRELWGQQVLLGTVARQMMSVADEAPETRTFWLLLSSGYKTYRLLPTSFLEFFPRYDTETPPTARRLIRTLAAGMFGAQYHEEAGIVRFDEPAPLQAGVAGVDSRHLEDPHIEFFVRANPGHAAGDELVCIAELTRSNLTSAVRGLIGDAGACRDG